MNDRSRLKRLSLLLIGAIFLASALVVLLMLKLGWWTWLAGCYDQFCDREWVRQMVQARGWAASAVFVALQVGQVVFAPIPGDVTGILGGYLFGPFGGALLSTLGLTIGSMLNFFIGHFLGERVVRRMVSCETYAKYNELVQYKGILVIFIFFLVPGFPKDYLCLFLGLTTLPAGVFFVVSTVARIPGTVALSLQGASIFDKNYMFFVILTALCLLFAVGAYLVRDPLYRWMARKSNERVCGPSLGMQPKELPNR
ncbi:TVP38/TMEM64 family inner membrane protein YdjZ [uncultured bacterium]|nr:TVP38/TMEM64 family inner membrane protein YdjZ [uncultured bacterium]